jgi:hypothetical protein
MPDPDLPVDVLDELPPDPGPGSPPAGIPLDRLRRYRELRDAQKGSEAEAKALKDEADLIEAELIDAFTEAGTQAINIDGKTIYLHRSTFAQRKPGVDAEQVMAALVEAGAGDLIKETVNSQTLSSWYRELADAAEEGRGTIPEPVAEVLELGERYSVRLRASASRARR